MIIPTACEGNINVTVCHSITNRICLQAHCMFKYQVLSFCISQFHRWLFVASPILLIAQPTIFRDRCCRKARLPSVESTLIESPMSRTQQVLFPMQLCCIEVLLGYSYLLDGKSKLHHDVCCGDFGLNKKNLMDNFIFLFSLLDERRKNNEMKRNYAH